MNAQSNAIATRSDTPIDKLKTNLSSRADEFKVALPAHISFDKFQRTIATSLLLAAMKLAQDGLLPDGREAALVPFKRSFKDGNEWKAVWEVQPMPMAWGLRKKILQSGMVVSLETGLVYRAEVESGHFIYEIGMDPPIRHRPNLALSDEEMGDENIVAAYSIARIKSEHGNPYWSVEVMRRAEINKVREASQTGATKDRNGKPRNPKGPWVDWFGEMARKTVLRRHSKVLPMSGDVLDAFEREDEHLAAEGTARLLATEEAEPLRLPDRDELDQENGEVVDQETGEITTDSRGMSEVDEETARALDAGAADETDGNTGESEDAAEELSPSEKALREIRGGIEAAKNLSYLKKVDESWVKARAAYDEATAKEIDDLITAKRKALSADGEG
jgi:recombination protein RecT